MVLEISRKELNNKSPRDFQSGEKLRVGKYLIFIKQADWGTGNYATFAESDDNPMLPLNYSQMPKYLREFIFER